MNQQQAQKELMDSLTDEQTQMIKLFLSVVSKAWDVLQATLTDRQRELLEIMGNDEHTSEMINRIERMSK